MTASRSTHLTVRNLPQKIAAAVRAESRRRHQSLNQTVIELLAAATGVGPEPPGTNGLEKLAGSWGEDEFEQFETAIADMNRIDPELWK